MRGTSLGWSVLALLLVGCGEDSSRGSTGTDVASDLGGLDANDDTDDATEEIDVVPDVPLPDVEEPDVRVPACGDGILDDGEDCDDGTDNSDTAPDACRTDCTAALCGDGVVDSDEACEGDDGCENCQLTFCGDGVLNGEEVCDAGAQNSDTAPDACRGDCTPARCGDGVVDTGETCDGGVGARTCIDEGFGAGVLTCGEGCAVDTSGCQVASICGDGLLAPDEICDDGNVADGDGCSSLCTRCDDDPENWTVTQPGRIAYQGTVERLAANGNSDFVEVITPTGCLPAFTLTWDGEGTLEMRLFDSDGDLLATSTSEGPQTAGVTWFDESGDFVQGLFVVEVVAADRDTCLSWTLTSLRRCG